MVDVRGVVYFIFVVMLFAIVVLYRMNQTQQRTAERQQDTIQKLLNREPVTYKEVGKPEPKEEKELRYSAWGSRMLTDDDYNKEQ